VRLLHAGEVGRPLADDDVPQPQLAIVPAGCALVDDRARVEITNAEGGCGRRVQGADLCARDDHAPAGDAPRPESPSVYLHLPRAFQRAQYWLQLTIKRAL